MDVMQITALVLTKNEESNISRCLASLEHVDEILVVDSGSTDRTKEIAKVFSNVRLLEVKWEGFTQTKINAIKEAKHDWILWVDADEELSNQLKLELLQLKLNDPKSVFEIRRQNYFMDTKVLFSGWQNDWVVRIFNRNEASFKEKQVHERLDFHGEKIRLKNLLNHYTYKNLKIYLEKMDDYTTLGARDRLGKVKVRPYQFAIKPFARFIRHYFLQLGILDGKVGLIISLLSAHSVFLRLLKTYRLQLGETIE